ncbi:sulfotransferase [Desulfobacter postgatei]|jgi:hypothetical protein|uniref:sulfotransferase family protein n=1 Tax=Desulfobacter postgatei TaxID=2293 RepID=UPI002A36CEFE|nr:sulfotransferase [Desulfobacter postgatei]MDX9964227.1 sulfotransferase [Desulfobacter postgatei]
MPNLSQNLQAIFILGITPRSGTNYLHNLILAHPECIGGGGLGEDYLLSKVNVLAEFQRSVYNAWNIEWKKKIEKKLCSDPLKVYIGYGLLRLLQDIIVPENLNCQRTGVSQNAQQPAIPIKAFATVTPSVENIDKFFSYFPKAKLIILVRDGRSIVESGIRSFGWEMETAVRRWAKAADDIKEFEENHDMYSEQFMVVRYEDLFGDTEKEMKTIFSFLGLDPENYNYTTAANLPVTGSSDLSDTANGIHWKGVARGKNFSPLKRWDKWNCFMHERFNYIAGNRMFFFGYDLVQNISHKNIWKQWNKVLDLLYAIETRLLWRGLNAHKLIQKIRNFVFFHMGKYLSQKL